MISWSFPDMVRREFLLQGIGLLLSLRDSQRDRVVRIEGESIEFGFGRVFRQSGHFRIFPDGERRVLPKIRKCHFEPTFSVEAVADAQRDRRSYRRDKNPVRIRAVAMRIEIAAAVAVVQPGVGRAAV